MPQARIKIKDSAPIYGMNTVDDPKTLKNGECVRLLNMFPGDPPIPRNGCTGRLMTSTSDLRWIPPGISFEYSNTIYAIAWAYDGVAAKYKAIVVKVSDATYVSLGDATFTDVVMFDMLSVNGCIYSTVSIAMASWKSTSAPVGSKVFESDLVIRDMSIAQAGAAKSVTEASAAGPFAKDDCFEWAFQYVRRNDTAAFEAGGTPTGMILPPNITTGYKPKRMDTFLPGVCIGVESVSNRKTVQISAATAKVSIDIDVSHDSGILQGATHLRVSRSRKQTSVVLAQGATKFFLCDLPLGTGTTAFDDTTSDAALAGESNQLVTGYTAAPQASFIEYSKGRLFLMANDGHVYYSESVGGDGGTDIETAQAYPQAWASLFKPTSYYIDCDYVDGQLASGMKLLGDDLFFFKERKIFALYNGDPTTSALSNVSQTVGCAFPYTITKCEIKGMFGKCLLFLSNEGPMVMQEGGRLRPFSEFKIKYLWPDVEDELYAELTGNYDWIVHNCTASFFRNTWWVMYKLSNGTSRIFGYYFDPDMGADGTAPHGALEFQFASLS